jgi:hypothetical protein
MPPQTSLTAAHSLRECAPVSRSTTAMPPCAHLRVTAARPEPSPRSSLALMLRPGEEDKWIRVSWGALWRHFYFGRRSHSSDHDGRHTLLGPKLAQVDGRLVAQFLRWGMELTGLTGPSQVFRVLGLDHVLSFGSDWLKFWTGLFSIWGLGKLSFWATFP